MTNGNPSFDVGKNRRTYQLVNFKFLILIQFITIVPFLIITRLDRSRITFIQLIILPILGYTLTIYILENKNKFPNISFNRNYFWFYTIIIRIVILSLPIGMSDDIYRYLWDGHLQHENVNPYNFSPNNSDLVDYRTDWWDRVNNPEIKTPYPPFAQILFFIITSVTSNLNHLIMIFRIIMILFDLGIIIVIQRLLKLYNISERRIILYAWSPLVLFEISGNAHIDIVALFFMLLSVYFILQSSQFERYKIYSGISLALAFLTKFFPIVLLPFLILRWGIKGFLSFIGMILITTILYIDSGLNPLYPEGLRTFAKYFRFNESIFRLYRHFLLHSFDIQDADIVARAHYIVVMLIISFLSLLYFYRNLIKSRDSDNMKEYVGNSIKSYQFIVLNALLLGPDIHPWYLLWLLPFSLIFIDPVIISFSVTVLLSYQIYPQYDDTQIWEENHLFLLVEYFPVYVILMYRFWKKYSQTNLLVQS